MKDEDGGGDGDWGLLLRKGGERKIISSEKYNQENFNTVCGLCAVNARIFLNKNEDSRDGGSKRKRKEKKGFRTA